MRISAKYLDLIGFSKSDCNEGNLTCDPFAVHIAPPSGMFKEDCVALLAKVLPEDL